MTDRAARGVGIMTGTTVWLAAIIVAYWPGLVPWPPYSSFMFLGYFVATLLISLGFGVSTHELTLWLLTPNERPTASAILLKDLQKTAKAMPEAKPTYDPVLRQIDNLNRDLQEAAKYDIRLIGQDQSWSLKHCLCKLVEAARILLHDYSYDGHGHEEILIAKKTAIRYISNLGLLQDENYDPDHAQSSGDSRQV